MNSLFENKLSAWLLIITLVGIVALPCETLGISHSYSFSNGLEVNIYTPEEIISEMTETGSEGSLIFSVEEGYSYTMIDDIDDPDIMCKGDGSFHPHKAKDIINALREIDLGGPVLDIKVTVYLLPYPRRGMLYSSACGSRIFISPGVFDPSAEVSAYLVTHELGHCVQNKYLPLTDEELWGEYLYIRGLAGNPVYGFSACHCNNPLEIFAEDFRYLFGGADARYSGGIENREIPLPDMVDGLKEFIAGLVGTEDTGESGYGDYAISEPFRASNYPNPFNPTTTIQAVFDDRILNQNPVVNIGVYDVKGRLLTTLFAGRLRERVVEVRWDGRTAEGEAVGSGVYFYRVSAAHMVRSGKMLLVR